jgi:hypothetical protein
MSLQVSHISVKSGPILIIVSAVYLRSAGRKIYRAGVMCMSCEVCTAVLLEI